MSKYVTFLVVLALCSAGTLILAVPQNVKATMHKLISKDGKTMRQIVKGFDPQGKAYEELRVFDRQAELPSCPCGLSVVESYARVDCRAELGLRFN